MSRWEAVTPKEPVTEPGTLRQSLLATMDKCQYAGYLAVKHRGGIPSHPLFRGRAFHEVVERACRTMAAHGEPRMAPDDVKAILSEVLADHPEWTVPAADMDVLRVMVHHWAETFVMPPMAVVEAPFRMELAGRTVTGTIDLLWVEGDTVFIRDYKAGFGLYAQDEVSGKDSETGRQRGARAAQLIIYSLLVADGKSEAFQLPKGVNRFDTAFVFPMFRNEHGLVHRGVTIERPELIEHREWLGGLVRTVADRFTTGRFNTVPGTHCSRCPANTECPLPARMRMGSPFERDPREAAEDWLFMNRDAQQLKKELRAYVDVFGPIPVGVDQELAFIPVPKENPTSSRFDLRKRAA